MSSTLRRPLGTAVPRLRFCRSTDGVQIAYGTAGAGPPLVAAPAWLTHLEYDWDTAVWKDWFDTLAEHHTLLRYDLRGCGLSDRNAAEFTIDRFVDDLEAVVDASGVDRFPLFGLCQGGTIAAAYAARHPERVTHLILYGSYAQGGLTGVDGLSAAEEVQALALLIERGWGRDFPAFRELFARMLLPDGTAEKIGSLVRLEKQSATPATARDLWLAFHAIDIARAVTKIGVPTLVLHCQGDAMVPFSEGRRLATLIPGAQFVALEGRNHILQKSDRCWKQLWQEIGSFLDGPTATPRLDGARPGGGAGQDGAFGLTPREEELLHLIAQGKSNDQIAGALCIASKTVRNHVSNIFDKLSVSHRAEAIVRAREAGFGALPGPASR